MIIKELKTASDILLPSWEWGVRKWSFTRLLPTRRPQTQPLCQSISSGSGLRVGAMVLMKVETGHPKPPP